MYWSAIAYQELSFRCYSTPNPGWIDTPGEHTFYTEEDIQKGAQRLPWKRLGTIEDIGQGAVYLASDAADYVTGTTLRIDGGFMVTLGLSGGTGS